MAVKIRLTRMGAKKDLLIELLLLILEVLEMENILNLLEHINLLMIVQLKLMKN